MGIPFILAWVNPEHFEILASIQRRAPVEGRDHLVATVEWLFGVDAALADRLIPRVAAPTDNQRLDCEKPIRDEDGKFMGCEPGGGSSGGSSASGSPSHANVHEEHAARIGRIAAKVQVPKAKSPEHAAAAEKHRELLLRGLSGEDAAFFSVGMTPKMESNEAYNIQRQLDAIASGDVSPPAREHLDKYIEQHRPAIEKKIAEAGNEIGKAHNEAAEALAKLHGYNGDDLPEFDPGDIESSFGNLYDEAGISDTFDFPDANDDDVEHLDPPDDGDPADEYNEAAKAYNEAAEARVKGQRAAAEKAHQALLKLQDKQEEFAARLKAIDAENDKFARAATKEAGSEEPEDLLSPELAKIGKAIDKEQDVSDEDYKRLEEARYAASLMIDNNDRSDITSIAIPENALEALKGAKSATKKMIRSLERFLAKPPPEPARLELKDPDPEDDAADSE